MKVLIRTVVALCWVTLLWTAQAGAQAQPRAGSAGEGRGGGMGNQGDWRGSPSPGRNTSLNGSAGRDGRPRWYQPGPQLQRLTGRLLDPEGNGLSGATLRFRPRGRETFVQCRSKKTGRFACGRLQLDKDSMSGLGSSLELVGEVSGVEGRDSLSIPLQATSFIVLYDGPQSRDEQAGRLYVELVLPDTTKARWSEVRYQRLRGRLVDDAGSPLQGQLRLFDALTLEPTSDGALDRDGRFDLWLDSVGPLHRAQIETQQGVRELIFPLASSTSPYLVAITDYQLEISQLDNGTSEEAARRRGQAREHYARALRAMDQENYEEARGALESSLDLDPIPGGPVAMIDGADTLYLPYRQLGLARLHTGDPEGAMDALNRSRAMGVVDAIPEESERLEEFAQRIVEVVEQARAN